VDADLAAENRRLLAQVRRLEEDLADLKERLAYAQLQIRELRARVPLKDELRVGVPGVSSRIE
jgi:hypothetical protein